MSKDLEALEIIGKLYLINDEQVKDWDKRDFDIVEKSLKALEIIKKKEVSVRLLKSSYTLLEYYTKYKSRTGCNTELTQEEFNTLKEVLE